jgi:hypothetical protein
MDDDTVPEAHVLPRLAIDFNRDLFRTLREFDLRPDWKGRAQRDGDDKREPSRFARDAAEFVEIISISSQTDARG